MNFFARRRIKKQAGALLGHARNVRNLREDVAEECDLRLLEEAEKKTKKALQARDYRTAEESVKLLDKSIEALIPQKKYAGFRDNLEILVVAIAVAMAVRTYFVQPFKIPTFSMYPTLHGVVLEASKKPDFFDRFPLRFVKWSVLGHWNVDVKAKTSGAARFVNGLRGDSLAIMVGDISHKIPGDIKLLVAPGDWVLKGQTLASGRRTAGDHILVNKMIWHFRRPKRGEIMVFRTDGIIHPQIQKNEHYVKRLVGMPGESLSISDPFLEINGSIITEPGNIARLQDKSAGYVGFRREGLLLRPDFVNVELGPDDFYACGDNQSSSLDSRFWGPVPRKNLVGPAFFIYWPFSGRWGSAN